ncbi:MAG: site-specific DNA-methyltransferase [Methylobacteriaceae bacterium]|nr:site-specific DNA-methyltransferase [Methylobacteriaceae bacterium]
MATPRIELKPVAALRPYPGNARTHSRKQLRQIADSIRRFGFTNPVLISDDDEIIAGHGRVLAARDLGLDSVPTIRLSHLDAQARRAYVLADNKLALNAGWDFDLLAVELQGLLDVEFDVSLTGFSTAEIDLVLDEAKERATTPGDPADEAPAPPAAPVTRPGDVWRLGRHRLLCGDARSEADCARLLDGETADLVFTDPPYNVPIDGHVCGLGAARHRDFAFASGEMSRAEFTAFLTRTLGNAAAVCRDGAIAFVCMDWRHLGELLAAGEAVFSELKNVCVWNKTNGGMGTFYRSKHELVFVFKIGAGEHVNTFGLGEGGRYRTNVWDYAGVSSLGTARREQLEMHPTVKPVALVADAIRDCSHRGDLVLDLFAGAGTTLIAAERCGRRARALEFDPAYCDTILDRWRRCSGRTATLEADGLGFDDVAVARGVPVERKGAGDTAVEPGLRAAAAKRRRGRRATG